MTCDAPYAAEGFEGRTQKKPPTRLVRPLSVDPPAPRAPSSTRTASEDYGCGDCWKCCGFTDANAVGSSTPTTRPHPDATHIRRFAFLGAIFALQWALLGYGDSVIVGTFSCNSCGVVAAVCNGHCSGTPVSVATAGVWSSVFIGTTEASRTEQAVGVLRVLTGVCAASVQGTDMSASSSAISLCEGIRSMAVAAMACTAIAAILELVIRHVRNSQAAGTLREFQAVQKVACVLSAILCSGTLGGVSSSLGTQLNVLFIQGQETWCNDDTDNYKCNSVSVAVGGHGVALIVVVLILVVFAVKAKNHRLAAAQVYADE